MILPKCIFSAPRSGKDAGQSLSVSAIPAPRRSRPGWDYGFPVLLALLLVFSSPFRTAVSGIDAASVRLEQEQRRLRGFFDALFSEGAIQAAAPCRNFDICVRVTGLFQGLEFGDKREIGKLIRQYFETRPDGGRFVPRVWFIDSQTGIALGGYSEGRLDWLGSF